MPILILESFRDEERIYSFDTERDVWECARSLKESEDGRVGTSGWADERHIGILKREKLFVAVFVLDDSVQVQLGQTRFKLRRESVRTKRYLVVPFVKRFVVTEGARKLFSANYWWADVHEWPGDEVLDVFLYIDTLLGSAEQVESSLRFWSLKAAGHNTIEAARKLGWLDPDADVR